MARVGSSIQDRQVNAEEPLALIWNRTKGPRPGPVGGTQHTFHPGLNILSASRWESARAHFEPMLKRADLEELGTDVLAVDPNVLVQVIRETGDQHPTFPKQAPLAALRWLEKRETRTVVVPVLREVLVEMDPLRSGR